MPKNVGDLSKLIVAKRFKGRPKCKKSSTPVTLATDKTSRVKDCQLQFWKVPQMMIQKFGKKFFAAFVPVGHIDAGAVVVTTKLMLVTLKRKVAF